MAVVAVMWDISLGKTTAEQETPVSCQETTQVGSRAGPGLLGRHGVCLYRNGCRCRGAKDESLEHEVAVAGWPLASLSPRGMSGRGCQLSAGRSQIAEWAVRMWMWPVETPPGHVTGKGTKCRDSSRLGAGDGLKGQVGCELPRICPPCYGITALSSVPH